MEGRSSFVLLLVIVAVLTLTLALLSGYVFIVGGAQSRGAEKVVEVRMPDSDELNKKPIFGDKAEVFNLKQDIDGTLGVMQLNAELVYFKKVKGIKNTDELIDNYISEIKEAITQYLLDRTYSEVNHRDGLQKAKEDLKVLTNNIFKEKEGLTSDVVWEVVISKWNVQAM